MKRAKYYVSQWDLIYRVKGGRLQYWVNELRGWEKSRVRLADFRKVISSLDVRPIRKPKHVR